MPRRPRVICHAPGCNERIRPRQGYCEAHKHLAEHQSGTRGFYNRQRWIDYRRWFLQRHPLCASPDCNELAAHVHHKQPISERLDLAFVESNCEGLCHSCHSRESIRSGERFGRRRRQ